MKSRRALLLLSLSGLFALSACATFVMGTEKPSIIFSHERHLKLDMDCDVCHATVASSTSDITTNLPSESDCLFCHQVWKDNGECAKCHVDPQNPRTHVVEKADYINHSHAQHMDIVESDCTVCHVDIRKSKRASDRNVPPMEACLDCHNHNDNFNDLSCMTCHRTLRNTDWRPLARFDHGPNWMDRHQIAGRERADLCAQCHDINYCGECHMTNDKFPPSFVYPEKVDSSFIHRDDWLSHHGLDARFEGDSCIRCHASNFCRDCHRLSGLNPELRPFEDGRLDNPHPQGWQLDHGRYARREIQTCAACHSGKADSNCVDCHGFGGFNPHPPGFQTSLSKTKDKVCRICHMDGE